MKTYRIPPRRFGPLASSRTYGYGATETPSTADQLTAAALQSAQAATAPLAVESEEEGDDYTQYAQLANQFLFGTSARVQVETLTAQIQNYQKAYKTSNNRVMKNIYANQINKLKAKLRAAQQDLIEEDQSRQVKRVTKSLAIVGGVLTIGILIQMARTLYAVQAAADRQ